MFAVLQFITSLVLSYNSNAQMEKDALVLSSSRARKPKYARAVYAHSGKRALYVLRAPLWDTRCCADTDALVVCGRPRVNRLWPVTTMQSWHRQDAGRMALARLSQKLDIMT